MLCKPTIVVMLCIVLNKTINTQACAKVRKLRITTAVIALAAKKNRGNNLVSYFNGVALCINGNALANCYNFTGSFMAKNDLLVTKRVVTILVNVSSADTAALNLNKNFTGTGGRDFNVAKFNDCLALNAIYNLRFNKICYFLCCHNNNSST